MKNFHSDIALNEFVLVNMNFPGKFVCLEKLQDILLSHHSYYITLYYDLLHKLVRDNRTYIIKKNIFSFHFLNQMVTFKMSFCFDNSLYFP